MFKTKFLSLEYNNDPWPFAGTEKTENLFLTKGYGVEIVKVPVITSIKNTPPLVSEEVFVKETFWKYQFSSCLEFT